VVEFAQALVPHPVLTLQLSQHQLRISVDDERLRFQFSRDVTRRKDGSVLADVVRAASGDVAVSAV